jgi:hypothetical protein
VIPLIEARAGAPEGARRAFRGLHLGHVVDRHIIVLVGLDHRREAVGLEVVVQILEPRQQAERNAVMREMRPRGASIPALRGPVGDGVTHRLRALLDVGHDHVERPVRGALRLRHRELQGELGEAGEPVYQAAQVRQVRGRDHAVRGEILDAAVEQANGADRLIEGVGAHDRSVHLRGPAVQRHIDVPQPARVDELVGHVRIREHEPVGDQAEIEPEPGGAPGPAEQLRPHCRLAPREHDHGIAEPLRAIDLPVDARRAVIDVAHVGGVAERAVLVARVADLDERLHDSAMLPQRTRRGGREIRPGRRPYPDTCARSGR